VIVLRVSVATVIEGWVVEQLGGKLVTWEGVQRLDPKKHPTLVRKPDRFASLNPDGPCEVRVAVDEKLGGPKNSFSSVSVRVEISARCNQDEESIEKARDVLFKEGLRAVAHYMNPALDMLVEHTQKG
jgi:hypothetical protein